MVSTPPFSPADELQRAGELLLKNPILALPTALASLALVVVLIFSVISALGVFFLHPPGIAAAGLVAIAAALALLLCMAALIFVAQAVVMHASEDAWEGRPVDLAASLRATLPRLGELFVAMLLVVAIMFVPILLSFVLIGIPLAILAGYFLMYVTPAVILGNEGAVDALATSFRLARTYVGESVVALIGILIALTAANLLNAVLIHIPLINLIAGFAVGGLSSAYTALVGARFYMLLRAASPQARQEPSSNIVD